MLQGTKFRQTTKGTSLTSISSTLSTISIRYGNNSVLWSSIHDSGTEGDYCNWDFWTYSFTNDLKGKNIVKKKP